MQIPYLLIIYFKYQVTEEYSYLKLDAAQNYYNVQYEDDGRVFF